MFLLPLRATYCTVSSAYLLDIWWLVTTVVLYSIGQCMVSGLSHHILISVCWQLIIQGQKTNLWSSEIFKILIIFSYPCICFVNLCLPFRLVLVTLQELALWLALSHRKTMFNKSFHVTACRLRNSLPDQFIWVRCLFLYSCKKLDMWGSEYLVDGAGGGFLLGGVGCMGWECLYWAVIFYLIVAVNWTC